MESSLIQLRDVFAEALYPPDTLTIDRWADQYRILPEVSSSEHGPYRTSRFPFLKEVMYELSPESPTEEIIAMKGAQLGFTDVAVNMIMFGIEHEPAPMLYVQKTLETVTKFSKQRLNPSIDLCPRVKELVGPTKSRDASNTIRLKSFPGGILILGGANSASSLRSMPIMKLILDEEESYDADIEEEGSPSDIAIRRTANFPRRKIFRLSTPAIKETSKIEPLYQAGDQRRFYLPCPGCGFYQVLYWRHIRWEKGDASSVRFQCEACKKEFDESNKTMMLENGEWRKARPGRKRASFHISSLYSPVGFYGWEDAVEDWEETQETMDKSRLKVFVNTVLGETFSESINQIGAGGLLKRKEDYSSACPEGVLVLTAGADVQEDRIEVEIVGWGKNQESWSIDYAVFMGDTESTFVWEQLDQYLLRLWRHAKGVDMNLACVAIDSGHRAKVVYNFCRLREHRRIFPVKGRFGWGTGYLRRPKSRNEFGVYLFLAMVDELKSKVYSHLKLNEPGAGYCHYPRKEIYDKNYFRALTSEKLVTSRSHGRAVLQWELPQGYKNEALDCRCYAITALNILNPNFELLNASGPLVVANRKLRRKVRVLSKGI